MRMCARVCVFGIAYKLLHCFEYTRKWQRNQPIVVDRWIFSRAMIVLFFLSQFGKSQTLKPDCRTIRMFVSLFEFELECVNVSFFLSRSLSDRPTKYHFFWSQQIVFFLSSSLSPAIAPLKLRSLSFMWCVDVSVCANHLRGIVSVRSFLFSNFAVLLFSVSVSVSVAVAFAFISLFLFRSFF